MNSSKKIDLLRKVTLIVIAIVPIVYLNRVESVPLKAFILGTGSWGIGLIFKMIAHQLTVVKLQKNNSSPMLISVTNGFLSGLFELGAAFGVILLMKDKFVFDYMAIIGFGLGIGALESLIIAFSSGDELLKGTALEKSTQAINERLENLKGKKWVLYHYLIPVGERILAMFIHISTRGLVFVSIFSMTILPMIIALLVFIIADGLLGYYFTITGKLMTDKGYFLIFLYLFLLTAFVMTFFFTFIAPYKDAVL